MSKEEEVKTVQDVVVVFLSCKWDDTEKYCLNELTAITPHHWVMWAPLNNESDADKLLEEGLKYHDPVKLLIIVNDDKKTTRYYHLYKLHIAMEGLVKACCPFIVDSLEDVYCPRHDTMSYDMMKKCDEQITAIKEIFKSDNPFFYNKTRVFI